MEGGEGRGKADNNRVNVITPETFGRVEIGCWKLDGENMLRGGA